MSIFQKAKQLIPGGVNSPVRAFKSVGIDPVFIKSASGSTLTDINGKQYIDFIGSWGPMILGHAHPAVTEAICTAAQQGTSFGTATEAEITLAERVIEFFPNIEMLRMVNSGTEATMSALRLARAFTKRDKVIKFAGCYHGHADSFLVAAGSGALTLGLPDSPGVTPGAAADTLIAQFNDIDSVSSLIDANLEKVAAIIVEPVIGNAGVIPPVNDFLQQLRDIADHHNIVLIFDEVMTGFRVAPGGAQQLYNVKPDMTTLGKVIGGGLPVGAFGGRKEIMQMLAPAGPVYQAGTLSGNPLAVAAGLATLNNLTDSTYHKLESIGTKLDAGINKIISDRKYNLQYQRVGAMACLFFTDKPVYSFADAAKCDTKAFTEYYQKMLTAGILLPPSQFEAFFFSAAHTEQDIATLINSMAKALT